MLDTLKKILGKKSEEKGSLKVQGDVFNDVLFRVDRETLYFVGLEPPTVPLGQISDLQHKEKALSFIYDNKKFVFESENAAKIAEKLKDAVTHNAVFCSKPISYYTYNTEQRRFEKDPHPCVLKIVLEGTYYVRVEDDLSVKHYEAINTGTQYYMDQSNRSFVWSVFTEGAFHTFCVEFGDGIDFLEFSSKYIECSYKSVNQGEEYKYFESMATTHPVRNAQETNLGEEPQEEAWDEYEDEQPQDTEFNKDEYANRHLVIGNDLAFVTRGASLGVFEIQKDDLKFRTHIQNVLGNPQKIITHNQSQTLLVQDEGEKDKLQVLDLNRGEVIEKWEIKEEMNDYFDSVKFKDNGTLVGMTNYSLFRIDPRIKDKVAEKKTYKGKNEFSCGVATESGDVAIASRKGDLRLYNDISIRAKSLLPGFGDEILGIDSSKDGSMILCTCKNYILVFTAVPNYAKAIGKNKPAPKRLQLKPQHLSLIKDEVSFTPAKFDQDDTMIVTSTGRFVVKWRLEDVKEGDLHNYSLKALYDVIVDEKFVLKGEDIIVALPNDVKKVTEAELRRPR